MLKLFIQLSKRFTKLLVSIMRVTIQAPLKPQALSSYKQVILSTKRTNPFLPASIIRDTMKPLALPSKLRVMCNRTNPFRPARITRDTMKPLALPSNMLVMCKRTNPFLPASIMRDTMQPSRMRVMNKRTNPFLPASITRPTLLLPASITRDTMHQLLALPSKMRVMYKRTNPFLPGSIIRDTMQQLALPNTIRIELFPACMLKLLFSFYHINMTK